VKKGEKYLGIIWVPILIRKQHLSEMFTGEFKKKNLRVGYASQALRKNGGVCNNWGMVMIK